MGGVYFLAHSTFLAGQTAAEGYPIRLYVSEKKVLQQTPTFDVIQIWDRLVFFRSASLWLVDVSSLAGPFIWRADKKKRGTNWCHTAVDCNKLIKDLLILYDQDELEIGQRVKRQMR